VIETAHANGPLPKMGKPDSSLFPAGFQPLETTLFQWLVSQSPTLAISRRFTPSNPRGVSY
jgi:hypothetical protein